MAASLLRSACRIQPLLTRSLTGTSPSISSQFLKNIPKSNFQSLNLTAKRVISTTPVKQSGLIGHDKLWLVERVLSGGLLLLIPTAFMYPSAVGDYLLATTFVVHAYIGLKSVVTDYVRPVIFGKLIPPVAQALLLLITVLTAAGLFQFIQNDVGLAKAIKRIWAIKASE